MTDNEKEMDKRTPTEGGDDRRAGAETDDELLEIMDEVADEPGEEYAPEAEYVPEAEYAPEQAPAASAPRAGRRTGARRRTPLILTVAALLASLFMLPQFFARTGAEAANRQVVFSLLYSDLCDSVSADGLSDAIAEYADAGVTTAVVSEDTMGKLRDRGDVTGLTYHDLRHRFDAESAALEEKLAALPGITRTSHVFVVRRREVRQRLDKWLPLYYGKDEYTRVISEQAGLTAYVFYNGNRSIYDLPVGFDEGALENVVSHGLIPALSLGADARGSLEYIGKTEELIKKYGVRYLLVTDSVGEDADEKTIEAAEKCAEGLAGLTARRKLTLVVTENPSQLSNVKFPGYEMLKEAADGAVVRAYFASDVSHADETGYVFRARQYVNSVVDRNIRFICVSGTPLGELSGGERASLSAKAVSLARDRLTSIGFGTDAVPSAFSYGNQKYVFAAGASVTALCVMAALSLVTGLGGGGYTVISLLLAAVGFELTFFMPERLLALYPTAAALAFPCLAVALALFGLRRVGSLGGRYGAAVMTAFFVLTELAVCAVGGVVIGALTSGVDYYINDAVFRGIKLTLVFPLAFALFAYYFMFCRSRDGVICDVRRALGARVRVWWCLALAAAAAVLAVYLVRSGNVNRISSLEESFRNFISDRMASRPRTKEFLVAYPATAAFVYFFLSRKGGDETEGSARNAHLFALAAASAILPASVTNTFCHVFTDAAVQYGRVMNGLLFGIVTSAAVLVVLYCASAVKRRVTGKK